MTALIKYDAACRALAEAKAVDEVRDIRDQAEALRTYARLAKNKQLEVDAAEIRLRSERRVGELMALQREHVGLNSGESGQFTGGSRTDPPVAPPTLADAGIDKHLADRARKLAAVPEEEFEEAVTGWRERVEQEGERVTVALIKRGAEKQSKGADEVAAAREKKLTREQARIAGLEAENANLREQLSDMDSTVDTLVQELQAYHDIEPTPEGVVKLDKIHALQAHIKALEARMRGLVEQVNEWKREALALRKKVPQ